MNDFQAWIDSRNAQWSNPTGFLAVTSINWLDESPQKFDDIEGSWWAIDHEVHSTGFGGAAERVWQVALGAEITEPTSNGVLEIASRGGRIILRPRNRTAPALERFDGARVFDYDPALAVTATLVADEQQVGVSSFAGELGNNYSSPGRLSFELHGENVELIGFSRPDPDALWVIFRDATSGKSTYGTGRSVTATRVEGDRWQIDFNRSANFPCSYTDFATCPLAPRENYLAIAIEGGEKTPPFRVTSAGLQDQ
jgi:uncharacterized protein (DUF1684 family)